MTARRIFTVLVFLAMASVSAWGALTITNGNPPGGIIGQLYSYQFAASAPATWTLTAGSLPPGLTLSSGGLLSGQLTQIGQSGGVITATSGADTAGAEFGITVSAGPLTIDTTTFNPKAAVGTPYSKQLGGTGGTPPYSWSLVGGATNGIGLSSSGVLAGTPAVGGNVFLNVVLADSVGATTSGVLQLNVLGIDTASQLSAGSIGTAYSKTLTASGGIFPFNWTVTGSTPLPPGLTLSSAGTISGSPTTNGTYPFNVTVTDSKGNTVTKNFSITIGTPFNITTTTLPNAAVGTPYSQTLASTGGTAPITWTATGLPATLTLSSAGVLSGTPAATGNIAIAVTATDAQRVTAQANLTLAVVAAPFNITTTSPLPPATVGFNYSQAIQVNGGVAPLTWSASGLPAGLAIAPATGVISGIPSAAGSTNFTVTATDAGSATATANFTLVATAPTLTVTGVNAACFVATQGRRFPDPQLPSPTNITCPTTYSFTATGGTAPYTFSVPAAGTLPPGLTLSSAGVLTGTPTAAGTYNFTVSATDSLQAQGAVAATITVGTVAPPSSVNITLGGNVGPAIAAASQPAVVLSIGNTYPFPVNGTLAVSFVTAVGGINSLVTFSNGSPTTTFRIPANTNIASITSGNVLTGTQAGTITLSATSFTDDFGNDLTVRPPSTVSYTVSAGSPVITKVTISNASATGMTIAVTGYSTSRDMTSMLFHFTPTTNTNLGAGVGTAVDVTVPLTSAFSSWYADARSNPFGSTFVVTIPFTFSSTGPTTVAPVAAVTVNMTNSKGTSSTSNPVNP